MAEIKNRIKFWRGSAEAYNLLAESNKLDYWTRYSVKIVDSKTGAVSWKEYYGDNLITEPTGQLLPVIDIVPTLPTTLNPGDRYLVGIDATEQNDAEYYIVEVGVYMGDSGYVTTTKTKTFEEGISVRVKNKGFKSYVLVDGEIVTYDEVDCGTYE